MRALLIKSLCFGAIITALGAGCKSTSPRQRERADVGLQLQRSITLAAGRYVAILKALDAGDLDDAKRDLDWWIDLAILELQALEERYPQGHWEDVPVQGSPDIQMRAFYRQIAQFRRDHPRRHSVPLDADSLKLIAAFLQKHQ